MNLPFTLSSDNLRLIQNRLAEFKNLNSANTQEWFSELCFCILTANSKALNAINIQKELGVDGFVNYSQEKIIEIIKKHKHRFHNNKTAYIIAARNFINIKEHIKELNGQLAREFLVKNIKGIGYKEASHFLRNVGYSDVAIIDRHIIRFLFNNKIIDSAPKAITKKHYLDMENKLLLYNLPLDLLDLMIWCHVTSSVLK